MIRVYNTLSKTKEPFETVRPGEVGIYLCGPTVYKPSHIGHMVGPVIFDAIKRYLVYSGYRVRLVINITDVDDKLIAESNQRQMSMPQLAAEMTADYMRNLEAMGVDSVDHFPRATENMEQIISFTQALIDKGCAYASEGDVYFDVATAHDYGKLSHRTLESMQGEGGDTADRKRNSADFALWKRAKPGEPSWPSPWGPGRPGWHIECSVMSKRLLGDTFDIHGGGLDLVFPHHENEIAQSETLHDQPMAKYWLHNGLMQASDEVGKVGGRATRPGEGDKEAQEVGKISKSRGASPFREMLAAFPAEAIRFFLLSTHYRRPIDFSETRTRQVQTGMEAFYRFFKRYQQITGQSFYELPAPERRNDEAFQPGDQPLLIDVAARRTSFLTAMDDDFNTGGAIGDLFELLRRLNRYVEEEKLEEQPQQKAAQIAALKQGAVVLRELSGTVGLFRKPLATPEKAAAGDDALVGKLVNLLIEARADARKAKNFAAADKIRNSLADAGILLEDRPGGTQWSRKE